MVSDRGWRALRMRRDGATYVDIAAELEVSAVRARDLVMQALRTEAQLAGRAEPTAEAYEGIKYRRRNRPGGGASP